MMVSGIHHQTMYVIQFLYEDIKNNIQVGKKL